MRNFAFGQGDLSFSDDFADKLILNFKAVRCWCWMRALMRKQVPTVQEQGVNTMVVWAR